MLTGSERWSFAGTFYVSVRNHAWRKIYVTIIHGLWYSYNYFHFLLSATRFLVLRSKWNTIRNEFGTSWPTSFEAGQCIRSVPKN